MIRRAVAWLVFLSLAPGVRAQQPLPVPSSQAIRINYVNADLADVIRSLSAVLGVNVVLTGVPQRTITFQTPEPVPAAQAGEVLESILESQGLVIVQTGPVAEVMPVERRPATGPLHIGKELVNPPPLGLITQIVPLDYTRADEAVTLLRQIASQTARIEVVPRSNAVLITDRGTHVARYLDLVRQLDQRTGGEAGLRTFVYPLKHASAAELATTLGEVFGASVAAPAPRQRVQALEGKSLSATLSGFETRQIESMQQRTQPAAATSGPNGAPPDTSGGQSAALGAGTTIVPDQATNSLVIRTAAPNFPVLQETIEQLDVRPPQVLLEVLIAEVALDRASQYGINWQLFAHRDTSTLTVANGGGQFTDSVLAGLAGLGVRLISLANVDVRALLAAVASHTHVRVLSAPRVLALNNEMARILVGSQVPFTSATQSSLNAVINQVVQFENVGTQLTVVPTINHDGYVTFRILQEVSALTAQTIAAAQNAPVITTREAETSAIVRTGQTVVIGGLIGEDNEVTQTGIPLLSGLPLFGGLFRSRNVSRERTELAIFLTPFVVFTDEQADSLLMQERAKFHELRGPVDSVLGAPPADSSTP
jgi:general secretion pathway protein D